MNANSSAEFKATHILRINKRTGERYMMMNSDDMYCESNHHNREQHHTLNKENTRVVTVGKKKGKTRVWCVDCYNQDNESNREWDLMKKSKLMCPIQYTKCICCLETKKSGYGGEEFEGCRRCKNSVCRKCLYEWLDKTHRKNYTLDSSYADEYCVGVSVPCFVCRTSPIDFVI